MAEKTSETEEGMYYDEGSGTLNFVIGVALGALVGAGVALLLAPQAGSRTRRKLVRRAEDFGDAAGERLEYAAEDLKRAAENARRVAGRSGGSLGGSLRRQMDRGRRRLNL